MAKTDYNRWIMHLHLGVKGIPLTVYPTNKRGVVTVLHDRKKYESVPIDTAYTIVGRAIMRVRGNVSF